MRDVYGLILFETASFPRLSIVVAKKNSSFFLALGQKPIAIAHLGDVAG